MQDVSTFRLNVMRVMYLMVFVFLVSSQWPRLFDHGQWSLMHSVAVALLAALGLLMGLGLRYPLRMLPVLLFEFLWKLIWLLTIALPLWKTGRLDADYTQTTIDCVFGVVVCLIAIPWKYVWASYIKMPGDRWLGSSGSPAA